MARLRRGTSRARRRHGRRDRKDGARRRRHGAEDGRGTIAAPRATRPRGAGGRRAAGAARTSFRDRQASPVGRSRRGGAGRAESRPNRRRHPPAPPPPPPPPPWSLPCPACVITACCSAR
ncbi:hypothetical protein ISF6_2651 [Piscinibacter sakaiensis]|uniref:Uncharacterized protein n=1 Tax=Piscinibacter sakaiensis TaxID=1547922 RepID=A0A0K8P2F6_PISS1|nr:hypothetical protein ISF6_2651 [Piscinibacter sakaiensis]